jgi:hypothetical protein
VMQYNHPHDHDCICGKCLELVLRNVRLNRTPECYGSGQVNPGCRVCTYHNNCEGMRMGRCLD